ncbi:MAG: Tad domain-containing protein [Paracoccaceae bacterium]
MQGFEQDRRVLGDVPVTGRRAGFLRSEDGSLIVFGLFVFLMMAAVAGMAVDFMRFETQRTRLQSTLDRAILAASSLDQALDPEEVVLDYFNKAGLGNFIDASRVNVYENDRLIDENWAGASDEELTSRRVEATARMTIGTTFLAFPGSTSSRLRPPARQRKRFAHRDLAGPRYVRVDVLGVEFGSLEDLRVAPGGEKFVNIVLCDPAFRPHQPPAMVEEGTVSVSVVPYSEQVLVGETLLSYFNATDEHDYSSCITFDEADFEEAAITTTQLLQREGHIDPWSSDDAAGGDDNRTCQTDLARNHRGQR